MSNEKIEISLGNKRYQAPTVNVTLDFLAKHFGCKKSELYCESVEPVYGGRMVWVYSGQFDADTAASLFVPTPIFCKWANHKGVCRLN